MSAYTSTDLLQMAGQVLGATLRCTRLGWFLDVEPSPVFGKDQAGLLLNVYRWNQQRWAGVALLLTIWFWGGAPQ